MQIVHNIFFRVMWDSWLFIIHNDGYHSNVNMTLEFIQLIVVFCCIDMFIAYKLLNENIFSFAC